MTTASLAEKPRGEAAGFRRILVALDASEHADRALAEALRIADPAHGVITGIHAYAAKLHDRRFRQMEGGLPERYLQEQEMNHQRDVHDDLIGHGLAIITDSYHDVAQRVCGAAGREYRRLSPEGKNYACVVRAMEEGDYDLLAMGATGLGKVPGGTVGSVCERVVRRACVDVLVIREAAKSIGDGAIVVALDGSARSFGALWTAFALAARTGAEIHAVAAYDPYYHYVAFNKIAAVLSEEAGKVFRFKEQEQLHEELIDEGIAKIYQSHLDIAKRIAGEAGVPLYCELLEGKPWRAVADYLAKAGASLLVVGRTGVHADDALDIGGNAENLLRESPCHIWLGAREHVPELDVVAENTIAWSKEAEGKLAKAPEFARAIARKAVIRYAHERGHTFITADFVEEMAAKIMPPCSAGRRAAENNPIQWSAEAQALIDGLDGDAALHAKLRAEKRARRAGADTVLPVHVTQFLDDAVAKPALTWTAGALARMSRTPKEVRHLTRARIEALALDRKLSEITLEVAEEGIKEARDAMCTHMASGGHREFPEDGE
ncbi:MAG: universal stress protein [Alphaproteobacteria bacterium]